MIPTRPSPARCPQGGVPAARWTFFAPHSPNSVARAGGGVLALNVSDWVCRLPVSASLARNVWGHPCLSS